MFWLEKCREWVVRYDPVLEYPQFHHYAFVRKLSERLPGNAIVVYDTGGNAIMMGHCFRSTSGQRIFASNGNSPMGFALCGAIGAWFAEPSRPVFCLIGDGGLQLNIQELQTLVHYGARVKIFILNNHILGNTKGYQRVNRKPEIACGPDGYSCPDFVRIAEAYGIRAFTIDRWWDKANQSYQPDTFEEVVPKVLKMKEPVLVDVVHHDFCTYEPRISRFNLPIEDMQPFLPREEFSDNMLIEPWKGWEENI